MKIVTKLLTVIALIGMIMKFTMIPLGSTIMVFSGLILSVIYLVFGFAIFNQIGFRKIIKPESYKGLSALRILGAIAIGFTFFILINGILSKLQDWPGANLLLVIGLLILTTILIVYSVKYYKTKAENYLKISKGIIALGLFSMILLFTSNITLVKIEYRNHPRYIHAYELYVRNPSDRDLYNNLDKEYYRATLSKEDFERYIE